MTGVTSVMGSLMNVGKGEPGTGSPMYNIRILPVAGSLFGWRAVAPQRRSTATRRRHRRRMDVGSLGIGNIILLPSTSTAGLLHGRIGQTDASVLSVSISQSMRYVFILLRSWGSSFAMFLDSCGSDRRSKSISFSKPSLSKTYRGE